VAVRGFSASVDAGSGVELGRCELEHKGTVEKQLEEHQIKKEIFRRLNRPRGEEVAEDANNLHEAPKMLESTAGERPLKRSRRANAQKRPGDLKAGVIADPFDPEERAGEVSLR